MVATSPSRPCAWGWNNIWDTRTYTLWSNLFVLPVHRRIIRWPLKPPKSWFIITEKMLELGKPLHRKGSYGEGTSQSTSVKDQLFTGDFCQRLLVAMVYSALCWVNQSLNCFREFEGFSLRCCSIVLHFTALSFKYVVHVIYIIMGTLHLF